MKINGEDLSISKEKKSKKTLLKIIITFLSIFIIFTLYEFFFIFKIKSDYDFNQEILENGQKYEKSIYIKYKGKIYAYVYGVSYQLDDVDIGSFRVIDSMDYFDNYVAVDKKSVYFGNISIPDLNPNTLSVIGNNYYSDGINSYFCLQFLKKNENLANKSKIRQYIEYYFFKGEKPQEYSYPFKKIETNNNLMAVKNLSYFATDGEKVYYQGEVLENADLNTLKSVDGYNEYFADKENVYYQSKLLPIKNSGKLIVVSGEQGDEFLYDEANGYVFIEDYSFDREKAPYKVIGNNGNHLYNLAFVNNEGIYYYDNQKKKQLRAGDNIFVGNVEELSPNVFMDNENIYYFHAYDVWKRRKHSGGRVLSSRNTEIYYLDKKDGWEKVKDIKSGTIGSIWKKGNKYYYFDNLGIFQLIDNAIYEIRDKETLEYLLNYNEGSGKIGEFIENEKLIKIEGEKKIEIRVKYTTFFLPFKISGLLAFILGIVIAKVSHYYREKKNEKKF